MMTAYPIISIMGSGFGKREEKPSWMRSFHANAAINPKKTVINVVNLLNISLFIGVQLREPGWITGMLCIGIHTLKNPEEKR